MMMMIELKWNRTTVTETGRMRCGFAVVLPLKVVSVDQASRFLYPNTSILPFKLS